MVHIDKKEFDIKCKEVLRDVKLGEATSTAWIWMTAGAALAFIASCLKFKRTNTHSFKAERKAGTYDGIPRG
jgi:hypothetical protein